MQPKAFLVSGLFLAVVALAVSSPRPAEAQARPGTVTPYSTSFDITVSSGTGANAYSPDPVPANKRLVIEFASVVVTSTEKPTLYLSDVVNGHGRPYWIPLTLTDQAVPGVGDVYRTTMLVKLYHEGNGIGGPGAQCMRNSNGFTLTTCHITLTGYLIDK